MNNGELKMTKLCERCQYQYGLWREHCPGCGLHNKGREAACAAPPRFVPAAKTQRERKARARAKTACIFCQAPGAKHTCKHCDEPIHRNCRGLHEPACQQFQVERQRVEASLGVRA